MKPEHSDGLGINRTTSKPDIGSENKRFRLGFELIVVSTIWWIFFIFYFCNYKTNYLWR